MVQTPPHWPMREYQRQTLSESEAPCHPGIPRERHVCDGMRFFYSSTHDDKPARIPELLRRSDHSDDHIDGFLVVFIQTRWSESMAHSIRKTDPSSPQSALSAAALRRRGVLRRRPPMVTTRSKHKSDEPLKGRIGQGRHLKRRGMMMHGTISSISGTTWIVSDGI